MKVAALTPIFLAVALSSSAAQAQTRAEEDRADRRRRCPDLSANLSRERQAVVCAERFIARQGYTQVSAAADTLAIVPEGIEWSDGVRAWVKGRHNSLRARAFGVCAADRARLYVVFLAIDGSSARAVTMDGSFGSLRMEHPNFPISNVRDRAHGCRPVAEISKESHQGDA
jgi:hypothetical protein